MRCPSAIALGLGMAKDGLGMARSGTGLRGEICAELHGRAAACAVHADTATAHTRAGVRAQDDHIRIYTGSGAAGFDAHGVSGANRRRSIIGVPADEHGDELGKSCLFRADRAAGTGKKTGKVKKRTAARETAGTPRGRSRAQPRPRPKTNARARGGREAGPAEPQRGGASRAGAKREPARRSQQGARGSGAEQKARPARGDRSER